MTDYSAQLARSKAAATSAEYALLLAIVGAGIIIASLALGTAVGGAMNEAQSNIETCGGSC
jgi:pilus assembly protein Flp/PilA